MDKKPEQNININHVVNALKYLDFILRVECAGYGSHLSQYKVKIKEGQA